MNKTPLALFFTMVVMAVPQLVTAQTEKVMKRPTVQGRQVSNPYVTVNELRNSSVYKQGEPKDKSDASGDIGKRFRDLYSVSSVSKVFQYLGKPESVERWGMGATLQYEGLKLEYATVEGKVLLRKLQVTGPEWGLTINGLRITPGMDTSHLSSAVRRAIESYEKGESPAPKGSEADAVAPIHVDGAETETRFLIRVNQVSGTVKSILFHRLV